MPGVPAPACGVFLIEASHYVEAKRVAFKLCRDGLSPFGAHPCEHRLREATLLERSQVKLTGFLQRLFGSDQSAVEALKNDFANKCSPVEKARPV